MQSTMESLNEKIRVNPDIVETLMEGKFNWDSLIEGAKKFGFDINKDDIEDYFDEKYPATSDESSTTYYVQDEEADEFRELSLNELEAVSGGTTIVAVVVYVAAIVFTAAAIATAVFAAQTVAIGAYALVAIGITISIAGSGGSVKIP